MMAKSFWDFLNSIDAPDYSDIEWRRRYPEAYSYLNKFLFLSENQETSTIPCPRQWNLRHEIVYEDDTPSEEPLEDCGCRGKQISFQDLCRYSFNWRAFCEALSASLGLKPNYHALAQSGCYQIGEWQKGKPWRHVYLCRGRSTAALETQLRQLALADRDKPIVIIAGTNMSPSQEQIIKSVEGNLLLLERLVSVEGGEPVLREDTLFSVHISKAKERVHIRIPVPTGTTWDQIGLFYDEEKEYFLIRVATSQLVEVLTAENMGFIKGKSTKSKPFVMLIAFAKSPDHDSRLTWPSAERQRHDATISALQKRLSSIFGIKDKAFASNNPPHMHSGEGETGWHPKFIIRTTDYLKNQDELRFLDKKLKYSYGEF